MANLVVGRGAPLGNQNGKSRRLKPWTEALRLAVHATCPDGSGRKVLRAIADKCAEMALAGDIQAMQEISNRLEGKVPSQEVDGAGMHITLSFQRGAEPSDDFIDGEVVEKPAVTGLIERE